MATSSRMTSPHLLLSHSLGRKYCGRNLQQASWGRGDIMEDAQPLTNLHDHIEAPCLPVSKVLHRPILEHKSLWQVVHWN